MKQAQVWVEGQGAMLVGYTHATSVSTQDAPAFVCTRGPRGNTGQHVRCACEGGHVCAGSSSCVCVCECVRNGEGVEGQQTVAKLLPSLSKEYLFMDISCSWVEKVQRFTVKQSPPPSHSPQSQSLFQNIPHCTACTHALCMAEQAGGRCSGLALVRCE